MLELLRKTILFCLWFLVGAGFLFVFAQTKTSTPQAIAYGVTFTPSHARYLGLDWQRVYRDALDDLGVHNFRLSAHWDDIESTEGQWNFSELDWQLEEARTHGASVILAIGRKLPRWPECRLPQWACSRKSAAMEAAILQMLETVVARYRESPVIVAWQVENEPYFTFGDCPKLPKEFYDAEVAVVRRADPRRPIIGTDSGELSNWVSFAAHVDAVGISMYQMTWNPLLGYFSYPLPPSFYARKAALVRRLAGKPVILTELQMEPWLPDKSIHDVPYRELEKSFTLPRFLDNVAFARATGFDAQYFWGVEWWAWAREHGHPEFWDQARELFKTHKFSLQNY